MTHIILLHGIISPTLKRQIESDIKEKFSSSSDILDKINWETQNTEYLTYAMLKKKFTFEIPFQKLKSNTFGNTNVKVQYFGLDATAGEDTFKQVTVLFHNSDTDFAIKIDTLEGEDLILYRTDNVDNFSDTYAEITKKSKSFTGKKNMKYGDDILKIPFLKVNAIINYDDLCNKIIKNSNGAYLKFAMQSVEFSLNNFGGNLTSEASISTYQGLDNAQIRYFNFTDTFVLYLKEKDKDTPYFALLVDNIDILSKI